MRAAEADEGSAAATRTRGRAERGLARADRIAALAYRRSRAWRTRRPGSRSARARAGASSRAPRVLNRGIDRTGRVARVTHLGASARVERRAVRLRVATLGAAKVWEAVMACILSVSCLARAEDDRLAAPDRLL